jgi:transposase
LLYLLLLLLKMASSSQPTSSSGSRVPGSEWPVATRSAVCLLKAIAADRTARFDGFRPTSEAIASLLGMSTRAVNSIYSDAKKRGFNPQARPLHMENSFFESASRSGRPTKVTTENQQAITQIVSHDKETRQLTSSALAYRIREIGIKVASTTVLRLLAAAGFKKLKPIRKPGLTLTMKVARLDFCLRYAYWTLEI